MIGFPVRFWYRKRSSMSSDESLFLIARLNPKCCIKHGKQSSSTLKASAVDEPFPKSRSVKLIFFYFLLLIACG
jgi:hypothetical protein